MPIMSKETKAFYRLVVTDARKTKRIVVAEYHASEFNPRNAADPAYPQFETDMQKMPILPKGVGGVLGEDDYLIIEAKDDGSSQSQIISTHQRLRIPITIRNRRTGVVTEKVLAPQDFTITTDFASANMSATYWREIAYKQVPAQEQWKLGHAIAHNSRVLIGFADTAGAA
jgi:hypothetical protein